MLKLDHYFYNLRQGIETTLDMGKDMQYPNHRGSKPATTKLAFCKNADLGDCT